MTPTSHRKSCANTELQFEKWAKMNKMGGIRRIENWRRQHERVSVSAERLSPSKVLTLPSACVKMKLARLYATTDSIISLAPST
jgi:hypothetical protein